ncbi:MAG: hypothetical protein IPN06_18745 [Burkholderiales bacterium]|nr:hypothetical protein [Burkholderiales bacterium]
MLATAFSVFLLQPRPFACYTFPRWQSALVITLIGVLMGLDPGWRAVPPDAPPGMAVPPLWAAVGISMVLIWLGFLVVLGVLRWWLKRGQRWDGQGDLFNLVAASWLVVDVLGTGLVALGVPLLWTLPLWLYSVFVGAKALSAGVPKASVGYSLGGIVSSIIVVIIVSSLVMGFAGFAMAVLSGVPPVAR